MKQVRIGMFYDERTELLATFYRAAFQAVDGEGYGFPKGEVNTMEQTITYTHEKDNVKRVYTYMYIKDMKDAMKISGMEFQAIFTSVKDKEANWYIQSRFRPQL